MIAIFKINGLSESNHPTLSIFTHFYCRCKDLTDISSQAVLKHLIAKLNACSETIPMNGNKALRYMFISCCQCKSTQGKFELIAEKDISEPNEHEPVNYIYNLLQTPRIVGMTEVKDTD